MHGAYLICFLINDDHHVMLVPSYFLILFLLNVFSDTNTIDSPQENTGQTTGKLHGYCHFHWTWWSLCTINMFSCFCQQVSFWVAGWCSLKDLQDVRYLYGSTQAWKALFYIQVSDGLISLHCVLQFMLGFQYICRSENLFVTHYGFLLMHGKD